MTRLNRVCDPLKARLVRNAFQISRASMYISRYLRMFINKAHSLVAAMIDDSILMSHQQLPNETTWMINKRHSVRTLMSSQLDVAFLLD